MTEQHVTDDPADEFSEAVNMTAAELDDWLDTDDSRRVGDRSEGSESTGNASGRRIVRILRKKKAEITDDDREHMRKVIGYVHRHLAQRPAGDISETPWRFSLMNWGHDPEK